MQYTCKFCGINLNPKDPGVWRRVDCWIKNGATGNIRKVKDMFDYAHTPCIESNNEQKEKLF